MEMDTLQKRLNDKADTARSAAIHGAFNELMGALLQAHATSEATAMAITCDDGSEHILRSSIRSLCMRVRDAALASEESKKACREAAARDFINEVESLRARVGELSGIVNN